MFSEQEQAAFLGLDSLSIVEDAAIEAEAYLAAYEAAVDGFAADAKFSGPEAASLLGVAVNGRAFSITEVAGVLDRLGPEHALTGAQVAQMFDLLGPEHAETIPIDVFGGIVTGLGLGSGGTVGDLLGGLSDPLGGGLLGGGTPTEIPTGDLGSILTEVSGGGLFTGGQVANALRESTGNVGEVCCQAAPLGTALGMVAPSGGFAYADLEAAGAGLVGLETFQERVFPRIGWGTEVCCTAVQPMAAAAANMASPIGEAASAARTAGTGADEVVAIEATASDLRDGVAALGNDTGSRVAADRNISAVRALIATLHQRIALGEAAFGDLIGSPAEQFPIFRSIKERVQDGRGFWMKTEATMFDDGILQGFTRTWTSEAFAGFTGGMFIAATDEQGKIIGVTPVRKWGVDAVVCCGSSPSSRKVNWQGVQIRDVVTGQPMTVAEVADVTDVTIYQFRSPKDTWDAVIDVVNDIIGAASGCEDGIKQTTITEAGVVFICK